MFRNASTQSSLQIGFVLEPVAPTLTTFRQPTAGIGHVEEALFHNIPIQLLEAEEATETPTGSLFQLFGWYSVDAARLWNLDDLNTWCCGCRGRDVGLGVSMRL